jgi:hypothetical protein
METELERTDKETGMVVEPPFYLVKDGSKIEGFFLREPREYQQAVLSSETFERFKHLIISREAIASHRLEAQLDRCQNAMGWHSQYVDGLWTVFQAQSFEKRGNHLDFIGYLSGEDVRGLLPKTYSQFQGKRDELLQELNAQRELEEKWRSLAPAEAALF